jgi:RNA polymerase sigma factor (sigma-70 family)
MAEIPETSFEAGDLRSSGEAIGMAELNAWFVREVLPLEAALMQYLRRSTPDAEDLCQDVFVRVYEAAQKQIPEPVKPFVFTTARNLLINRARREQIVSIESVADLDTLNMALDEPGPDRNAMAREELRKLQAALDRLPPRCREAVVLRKIEGLSHREIAARMGIAEKTVDRHICDGVYVLSDILFGEAAGKDKA